VRRSGRAQDEGGADAAGPIRRLRRADLPVATVQLARFLIGKTLVHEAKAGTTSGRIVETEAYIVGDAAGHAFRGQTRRNRSLFLERGHAYVYLNYGVWFLFNVSAETHAVGAGVLIRALEPMQGIEIMEHRRGTDRLLELARGPGRLTVAMDIGLRHDGVDLCADGPLWLGSAPRPAGAIGTSVRIGITRDAHRMLRFYERGNRYVSGPGNLRK
jgi:DNA-3-methyladenine glycosylase